MAGALEVLRDAERVEPLDGDLCLSREAGERLRARLLETLDAYHSKDPLQAGMPRAALAGSLPENVPSEAKAALVSRLAELGAVSIRGEVVARTGFESRLDADQEALAETLRRRFEEAGLDAPALRTLADDLSEDERRLREVAHYLERAGELVAAPDDLFFDRLRVAELIERVVAHFGANDELDTQTLKAMIGTSRRTAMPLMALLDDLQVTRRDGSVRRLIGDRPRW